MDRQVVMCGGNRYPVSKKAPLAPAIYAKQTITPVTNKDEANVWKML